MKTVSEIQKHIAECLKAIEVIQAACLHPSYKVMMSSYRPGAMNPMRVCDECKKALRPTEEEARQCLEEWNFESSKMCAGTEDTRHG